MCMPDFHVQLCSDAHRVTINKTSASSHVCLGTILSAALKMAILVQEYSVDAKV